MYFVRQHSIHKQRRVRHACPGQLIRMHAGHGGWGLVQHAGVSLARNATRSLHAMYSYISWLFVLAPRH